MEFKGQEGLKLLLQKGLDFGLWDQKFADSRWGLLAAPAQVALSPGCRRQCPWWHEPSVFALLPLRRMSRCRILTATRHLLISLLLCVQPFSCICVLPPVPPGPATLPHCCAAPPPRRRFTGNPVTAQPDVTELALQDDDEFVIVASDGLWDVMDSQEVAKLARRDLQRGNHPQVRGGGGAQAARHGMLPRAAPTCPRHLWQLLSRFGCTSCPEPMAAYRPPLQEVAAKLSALAVKRGSQDNIAVVLIDLGKVDWSKQSAGGGGLFGSLGSLFGSRG